MITRRSFLPAPVAALAIPGGADGPPVRAITRGPRFHWFGYYDKHQFDVTGRYALGVQGTFEHRLNDENDVIKIGMVDLRAGDRWIELGQSRAWSWHQTSMLQWLPGSRTEIVWNDRQGDRFVCHILDVRTRKRRTLPVPIYALAPDGRWAITTDFRRLRDVRPEVGYAGVPDPNRDVPAPEDAGIWWVDLRTGRTRLVVSIAEVASIPETRGLLRPGAKHWFNHLLVSPDGRRIVFLHRWRTPDMGRRFHTRMLTANPDGSELFVLDPNGATSHFSWRDGEHLIAWAWHPSRDKRFYLFRDRTDEVEPVAPDVLVEDGHVSYLPDRRWILTDTYPDEQRFQKPALYDTRTGRLHVLGRFRSPPEYTGIWRCDTTPRASRDGRQVIFDSPHGGNGRQMYLVDVSAIVGG